MCMCVCVSPSGSPHWALTFMEPAGHVRAHNDPREKGTLRWGRAEEEPGGLGVDGGMAAKNHCSLFIFFVKKNVWKKIYR